MQAIPTFVDGLTNSVMQHFAVHYLGDLKALVRFFVWDIRIIPSLNLPYYCAFAICTALPIPASTGQSQVAVACSLLLHRPASFYARLTRKGTRSSASAELKSRCMIL